MNRERALALQKRGLRDWIAMLGASSEGARVVEVDGVTASIVPTCPQRSIVNSVTYEDARALAGALDRLAVEYEDAGVAAWTVWTPGFDQAAIDLLEAAGHKLDGTPAAIRMVRPIADAVGDQVEVVMDGGIRRGSDVVKALALGARAVLIGRAYLWGLAANGQAGVENVLDVLRSGIDSTLLGLGLSSVEELGPEHLLVPAGFHRALGA